MMAQTTRRSARRRAFPGESPTKGLTRQPRDSENPLRSVTLRIKSSTWRAMYKIARKYRISFGLLADIGIRYCVISLAQTGKLPDIPQIDAGADNE